MAAATLTQTNGNDQPLGAAPSLSGYTAPVQTVDPNSLVSNQLSGLLGSNSPYIQQAIAQSQAQSAGRGLLNSTMAGGAGENAAIAAAEPIAAANASEYAQVGAANQQAATSIMGAQIAGSAQENSAATSASASEHDAEIAAQTAAAESATQFQEYGMGLGEQYAQLGQQGQEFGQQLQQSATQFTQQQNTSIGEFEGTQSLAQYQLGLQMQMNGQNNYATMFSNIMLNPNMTASDRSSALSNAQSFFTQESQYNATIPAFTPSYVTNPSYWSQDFTSP